MSFDAEPDLAELYREVIVEHGRQPRNFGELDGANRRIEGQNPLCGDELEIMLRMDGDTIADIAFTGSGCAISQASASLMTEAVKGMSVDEALAMFEKVHTMLLGAVGDNGDTEPVDPTELGKLAALGGVSRFPTRVKCAALAWQALRQVLDESDAQVPAAVTTE